MSEKKVKAKANLVKTKKILSLPTVNAYFSASDIEAKKHSLASSIFEYKNLEHKFKIEYVELLKSNDSILEYAKESINCIVSEILEMDKRNSYVIMQKKFLSQNGGKLLLLRKTIRYFVDSNLEKHLNPMRLQDLSDGEWYFLRKDNEKQFTIIEFYNPLDKYQDTIIINDDYTLVIISLDFDEESRNNILKAIKDMTTGNERLITN